MNLSLYRRSARRVPSLLSPPSKRGHFVPRSLLFRQALSQVLWLWGQNLACSECQLSRAWFLLFLWVWNGAGENKDFASHFPLVQEVWDRAAWLAYLAVLLGKPVKRCAKPAGVRALGIFCIRPSFDLLVLPNSSPWGLRWVLYNPAVVERRGSWNRTSRVLLAASWWIYAHWRFVVHLRPSALGHRFSWGTGPSALLKLAARCVG